MKKLSVTIKLEMKIPNGWEVVEHPDGLTALKIGPNQYMEFTFLPMIQNAGDNSWTSDCDDEFANRVLKMVSKEDAEMKLITEPGANDSR